MASDSPDPAIGFETKYVVFMDILGWSQSVVGSAEDNEHLKVVDAVIRSLGKLYEEGVAHVKASDFHAASPRYEFFSDTLVVSVIFDKDLYWPEPVILTICKKVARSAMQCGFLIRGGICRGLIRHVAESHICYGPALLRAYALESEVAASPRIVFDDQATESGSLADWFRTTESLNEGSSRLTSELVLKSGLERDADGHHFVDFLGPDYLESATNRVPADHRAELESRISMAETLSSSYLQRPETPARVRHKYEWLASYAARNRSRYLS